MGRSTVARIVPLQRGPAYVLYTGRWIKRVVKSHILKIGEKHFASCFDKKTPIVENTFDQNTKFVDNAGIKSAHHSLVRIVLIFDFEHGIGIASLLYLLVFFIRSFFTIGPAV